MDPVADSFLVDVAGISAGLTGLFLVGMIFYIQTEENRPEKSREVIEPYFRAATVITLILYAIPLGVSLTLVAVPIVWSRILFFALVVGAIVMDFSTVGTMRAVMKVVRLPLLVMTEVVGTVALVLMLIIPFAAGGLSPGRDDLIPAVLISLGAAFLGTCVLVLTLFDVARFERAHQVRITPTELAVGNAGETPKSKDPIDEGDRPRSE